MLIDKIELEFGEGLCVLTGETGAGKSMILESLELLSGARLKSNLKPENQKKTIISALIDITNFDGIGKYLKSLGIDNGEEVVIKRIIESDGKGKALINENVVSLSTLKDLSKNIIEIHSQFSEQGLLDNSTHIKTLDDFGGYENELKELSDSWIKFKKLKEDYNKQLSSFTEINNQRSEYEFYLKELRLLNPKENEFTELDQKRRILQNSRKIYDILSLSIENFSREEPPGVEKLISKNIHLLSQIKELLDHETIKGIDKLDSILLEITELCNMFEAIINNQHEKDSLESIDERVATFRKLSQKHNTDENSLYLKLKEFEEKIESTDDQKDHLKRLSLNLKENENKYLIKCKKVSEIRKNQSQILDKKINHEFPDLKLENALFKTVINECEKNELGMDQVIFNIQTNPKSKMDEIKKISSGGELCRIALAIKVTAETNNNSTIVFDEVDSGIGGAVSTAVGERLRKLGNKRQILVVTHSPQVASLGINHFLVKKKINEDGVKIKVSKLEKKEKINEIARMLSGKEITEEAVNAAIKLIEGIS